MHQTVQPRTLYISLFLFLLAVYMLTYTPRINSSDGLAMFSTAESITRRGGLDIEQIRWMDLQQGTYGLDGLLYSRKGIGVPVGLLPLLWLGLVVTWFGTVSVSLLFNAVVTALTATLLMAYLRLLGFQQRTGLLVSLAFGLTTLAWPYAKSLFSDPFSGLLLLTAAYALLKMRKSETIRGTIKYAFLAGLFLGWNVATRYAELLFLPLYGLLLLHYLYLKSKSVRNFWSAVLAFIAPILLIGLGLVAFNISRFGNILNTGYLPNETFSGILWQGVAGQLVSPGRGLLIYCPIFILSFAGVPAFFRRFRAEATLALCVIIIHLLLYGKWFMWHGGYAWGPRFMIPTLPFWAIFLAPVATRAFSDDTSFSIFNLRSAMLRTIFLSLAILGLIPQFLSNAIDFAPFQNSLLDNGLPLFAPQTFFSLQYSALLAAWSFISLDTLDMAWAWQGNINWGLLTVLITNIAITAFGLNRLISKSAIRQGGVVWVAVLSTLIAVVFLLVHTHSLPDKSLQQAISAINEVVKTEDAIIYNDPEAAMLFAELYKGRATVLGLNNGGFPLPEDITRRLAETTAQHQQIWWLPNWLPQTESAIEQTLQAGGFRVRDNNFDGQRLLLFAYPFNMLSQNNRYNTFAGLIKLDELLYSEITAGSALAIELRWQAITAVPKDYHVFIHLIDADGQIIAQADGQPVLWSRPTSTWMVGERITDRYGLWIPAKTEAGSYQLLVGLYNPVDNKRLHVTGGKDAATFKIVIQ